MINPKTARPMPCVLGFLLISRIARIEMISAIGAGNHQTTQKPQITGRDRQTGSAHGHKHTHAGAFAEIRRRRILRGEAGALPRMESTHPTAEAEAACGCPT